jgi:hypothetical protein
VRRRPPPVAPPAVPAEPRPSTLAELRPEWRDGGRRLVFDCPCGPPRCGSRIRVPNGWTITGKLPKLSITPSLWVKRHVHFSVNEGALEFSSVAGDE